MSLDEAYARLRKRRDEQPTEWEYDEPGDELLGVIEEINYDETKFDQAVPHPVVRVKDGTRWSFLIKNKHPRIQWDRQEPIIGDVALFVYRGEHESKNGGNPAVIIDVFIERLNAQSVEDLADPWPAGDEPDEPAPPDNTRW
jgi:hypothetical protein